MTDRVLVIKLGALGDFLFSVGPMQAIRRRHPEAELVLLTRPDYRALAEASGLFDEIWEDPAPRYNPIGWLALACRLRAARFSWVYDLQTSDRSAAYFRLFWPGPVPHWSGKVRGASHRHVYPEPNTAHTIERQRAQLALAGIDDVPLADLSFLDADVSALVPPGPFVVLIPGASPSRPAKRWPADRYGVLARRLTDRGFGVVAVGGAAERDAVRAILTEAAATVDLVERTGLAELAALARGAAFVVGNDTGPTHLMALAGARTLTLFSADSDPARTGPRGEETRFLARDRLEDLGVDAVTAALEDWMQSGEGEA